MEPTIEFDTTSLKNQLFIKLEWPISLGEAPQQGFEKEIVRILPTDERFSLRNEVGIQRRELLQAMFKNILGRRINKTLEQDKEISWDEVQRLTRRVGQGFSIDRSEAMGISPRDLEAKTKEMVKRTRNDWQETDEALVLKGGLVNEFFQGRIEMVVDFIKALQERNGISTQDLPLLEVMHSLSLRAKKEKRFRESFFGKMVLLLGIDELKEKIREIKRKG